MPEFMQGFVKQLLGQMEHHRGLRAQESEQELAQQRGVWSTLLQHSDDSDVKAMALTALINPPKQDFFGRLKKQPEYEHVKTVLGHMQGMDQGLPNLGAPPGPPPDMLQSKPVSGLAGGALPEAGTPPAPPTPGAAAAPDNAALTGGGGKTGPPPPMAAGGAPTPPPPGPPTPTGPPGPGMSISPIINPGTKTGVSTPPDQLSHPADQQAPGGITSYEEALALSRQRDPLGMNPLHQKFRSLAQVLQGMGVPWDQGKRMIHDELMPNEARLQGMLQAGYLRRDLQQPKQGKPIHGDALPTGTLDMFGQPIDPTKQYVPTWHNGQQSFMEYALPVKQGKIVYRTEGNKKIAMLVDGATGTLIKDNISEQEQALGHAIANNPDGSQHLIQFSRMPTGGTSPGTTVATVPTAPGTPPLPTPPNRVGGGGIDLGNKNKLMGSDVDKVTQAENAYKLLDDAKGLIEQHGLQDAKSIGDSLTRRFQSLLYKSGISQDDFNHDLQQKLSAADLKMISTFTAAGRMSPAMFNLVKQHLTRPEVVPPGVIYDDIKNLQGMILDFGKGTYRNAKVIPPEGSLFGTPAKPKGGGLPTPESAGIGKKDPNRPIKVKGVTKPFSQWEPDIQQRVLAAGG
jgi:hypothetical protein